VTVEVLAWRGLVTYYVLIFMHFEATMSVAGITAIAWETEVASAIGVFFDRPET
jgi:hypothetical protein